MLWWNPAEQGGGLQNGALDATLINFEAVLVPLPVAVKVGDRKK